MLLVLALASCGGAPVVTTLPIASMSEAVALEQMPALERQGQAVAMLALAKRVAAPHGLALQAAEIRALWLAGQGDQAVLLENAWLARVRPDLREDARLALDHARWHASRKSWPLAWHALEPLRRSGCRDNATCQFAANALTLWHPPELAALANAAAPTANPTPWLMALAERLAEANLLTEARAVLDLARQLHPQDLGIWTAWLLPDNKIPPPEARRSWLQMLEKQGLSADQLLAMAQSERMDRFTALALVQLATRRPEAGAAHWLALPMALLRADDADGLQALASAPPDALQSPHGKLLLARALLGVKLPALAQPFVAVLPADDAWTMLLQADLLRQTGQIAAATELRNHALEKAADRSEMALVAGQLLRKTADLSEALWLDAASHPGAGQVAAARTRVMDAFSTPVRYPMREVTQRVTDYARLLTHDAANAELSNEWPQAAAVRREELARLLVKAQQRAGDGLVTALRIFADAQMATPWMLRELALKALRDNDTAGFAVLDAKARKLAANDGVLTALSADVGPRDPRVQEWIARMRGRGGMPMNDERVLSELTSKASPVLAQWLHESGLTEAATTDATWNVVKKLLSGPFAFMGRAWAEHAMLYGQLPELSGPLLATLTAGGAADLTLDLLAKRTPGEATQEVPWLLAEVSALFALDRLDDAEARLKALVVRGDLPVRLVRPAVDLAWEHGLCEVVMLAVPRMLAGDDDYARRTSLQHGLDCARRHGREDWVETVLQASKMPQPNPDRIESIARELASFGFNTRAATVFEGLENSRPLAPDALSQWAKALLQIGRTAEAVQVLNRAIVAMRGRSILLHQRAAEMLEDFGELAAASGFWRAAVQIEPDNPLAHYRLIANTLRQGQTVGVADEVLAMFRAGPGPELLEQLQAVALKTGQTRLVYDALAGVVDADRDTERVRMSLAVKLGLRDAVEAGVRRLRAKRTVQSAQVPQWLLAVGDRRTAREVAEDLLASSEPTGAPQDRPQTLRLALAERRDPTSDAEALSLTRFYIGRALDPQRASMEAAVELARAGLADPARAVATIANQTDHPLRTCMLATFEHDAGHHETAMALWRKSMAGTMLDPRLHDYLGDRPQRDAESEEIALEVQCIQVGLAESHEYTVLAAWLHDLLAMAPDSATLRARLFQVQLLRGDAAAALAELKQAAQTLTELKETDWQRHCDRLLRDGAGPNLLAWLVEQGDAIRTEPWFLAFAASVLASQTAVPTANSGETGQVKAALMSGPGAPLVMVPQPQTPPPSAVNVRAALRSLAPVLPALRIELALQWAARGQPDEAMAALGDAPLSVGDTQRDDAIKAVAATVVSLSARGDAVPRLQQWLAKGRGVDTQSAVAQDLVRQGHPQLALAAQPVPPVGGQPSAQQPSLPVLKRRALVALGSGDDAALAAHWLRALRGQLASIDAGDDAVAALLRAGRVKAAGLLAQSLHELQPGMQPSPLADASSPTDAEPPTILALARAFRPEALAFLKRSPAEMNEDTAHALLQLAVAADPALALRWTQARAKLDAEPWRMWQELLVAAEAFGDRELAATALKQSAAMGAPTGLQLCPQLWLERSGTVATCLRGRAPDVLSMEDLADLAAAIAMGVDPQAGTGFLQRLAHAQHVTQGQFLAAAAGRVWALQPQETSHLRDVVRAWIEAMPPADRDSLVVVQLDELAALGLGEMGVAVEQRVWQRDPGARSERNNLAYSQFLAGAPPQPSLLLATQAATQTGGDSAYATLDTVASLRWALGDAAGAMAAQLSALASIAAGPRDPDAGISLPLVRQAEFLLARGEFDQARVIAALALQKPEEASTGQRARRVLQAVLRRTGEAPRGMVTPLGR
jgi:tetratricopeptide (TPR) repeat protein